MRIAPLMRIIVHKINLPVVSLDIIIAILPVINNLKIVGLRSL